MEKNTASGEMGNNKQHSLLELLYPKYRLYNDEYFGGKLPHIPILLRSECVVDGREAWGRFDCKATYSKITGRVIEVKNWGAITLLTKYNVPEEHYLQTLLHEMIHAYIILALKRYPKDPHGELFMNIANAISAQEGFDIQPENEMVSYSDMDTKNTDAHDDWMDDATANTEVEDDWHRQVLLLAKALGENAPIKYWVTRCPDINLLNSYLKSLFLSTSNCRISYDECDIPGFSKLPSDVNKLPGFGANTPQEMCEKLGKYCGVSPEEFYRFFGI